MGQSSTTAQPFWWGRIFSVFLVVSVHSMILSQCGSSTHCSRCRREDTGWSSCVPGSLPRSCPRSCPRARCALKLKPLYHALQRNINLRLCNDLKMDMKISLNLHFYDMRVETFSDVISCQSQFALAFSNNQL